MFVFSCSYAVQWSMVIPCNAHETFMFTWENWSGPPVSDRSVIGTGINLSRGQRGGR